MTKLLLLTLGLLFSSAALSLDGTYTDSAGRSSYTFSPDGQVIISALGQKVKTVYEVTDGEVRLNSPEGRLTLHIRDNGETLEGPMGMTLSKPPSGEKEQ